MLTAVSFDWNYEPIGDDGTAPEGYWIQSYLMIYSVEILDCLSICDATFMLSYMGTCIYYIYILHKKNHPLNKQFIEWDGIAHTSVFRKKCRYLMEVIAGLLCCSLVIVFLFILFEFAESGFFSPNGDINAGMLFMWSFLVKIFIGIRHIQIASSKKYHRLKAVFGGKHDHDHDHGFGDDDDQQVLQDGTGKYKMDTIDVEKGD